MAERGGSLTESEIPGRARAREWGIAFAGGVLSDLSLSATHPCPRPIPPAAHLRPYNVLNLFGGCRILIKRVRDAGGGRIPLSLIGRCRSGIMIIDDLN